MNATNLRRGSSVGQQPAKGGGTTKTRMILSVLLALVFNISTSNSDVSTSTMARTFPLLSDEVTRVSCSPNGLNALSGSMDGTLKLWCAPTGQKNMKLWGISDWLADSETFAIFYSPPKYPDDWDWGLLAQSKVAFITHCPINCEFFQRCHALGIRCFPYVNFYELSAGKQGVTSKDIEEFAERDVNGNCIPSTYSSGAYVACPNVESYQKAMVDWVDKIMALGADGVFVDNIRGRGACYGSQDPGNNLSKIYHQHEFLEQKPSGTQEAQNHAFAMLLQRIRDVIKKHKPDGALLGNSGSPVDRMKEPLAGEFYKYLDADMWEGFILSRSWKGRFPDVNDPKEAILSNEHSWMDWWQGSAQDLLNYRKAGVRMQFLALSNLRKTDCRPLREDAFFCYASARLAGMIWNGGVPFPEVADLYNLRLGRPLSDPQEKNGVYFCIFERGMVALNPDKNNQREIVIAPYIPTKHLMDTFYHLDMVAKPNLHIIDLEESGGILAIPKDSGRVYLFGSGTSQDIPQP